MRRIAGRGIMGGGIALRIALAAIASVVVGVAIVAFGVTIMGGDAFAQLMALHGDSTDSARRMFDESVTRVVVVAVFAGVSAAPLLAALFPRPPPPPPGGHTRAAPRLP